MASSHSTPISKNKYNKIRERDMKFSEYIREAELNKDAKKAIPEIKEFFEKYFKKFKIDVTQLKVELEGKTRFSIQVVGSAKTDEGYNKLKSALPKAQFKGIDGRVFDFINLTNVKNRYAISYDEGTFKLSFHIEPKEVSEFYKE